MPTSNMATVPIPQPPKTPLIGNILDLNLEYPLGSLERLADLYGPIYQLQLGPGPVGKLVLISSQELAAEACNEQHFQKHLILPLIELRKVALDALFTARNDEPNWHLAHKILMPAFGAGGIKGMYGDMFDIASQLVGKWERFGPDARIDAAGDFTRLTLDTIALCCMTYRFNSFYSSESHPFVDAMTRVLLEASYRTQRLLPNPRANSTFKIDIAFLHQVCDDIVLARKRNPTDAKDLLNLMIKGRDRETGQGLSDENIRYQMVTFLIAGHETTSGLLSFAFYEMLKTPRTLQAAQQEVDRVTGGSSPTLEHLSQLKYIDAMLKETLRLHSTAPLFAVTPKEASYKFKSGHVVNQGENVAILLDKLQKDPKVWGEDAAQFRPERMLNGGFERLPPASWKPFGNGMRACIGRPFAWQESLLVVSMILQRFNVSFADASYDLRVKQTLTIKPEGFFIKAKVRPGLSGSPLSPSSMLMPSTPGPLAVRESGLPPLPGYKIADTGSEKKVLIAFGSNSGTCESFAETFSVDALSRGYSTEVVTLDSITEHISKSRPTVIICPSYEGQPADNAKRFMAWLTSLSASTSGALLGAQYMVFGAGHRDWALTYQKVPRLIDDAMEKLGAGRLLERGEGDASGDLMGQFDKWEKAALQTLNKIYNVEAAEISEQVFRSNTNLAVTVEEGGRGTALGKKEFGQSTVMEKKALTPNVLRNGGARKVHLEVALPDGSTYKAGDYLAVMPLNSMRDVKRVLNRFKLAMDGTTIITSSQKTFLPTGTPVSVFVLLSGYVELSEPASRRSIETLIHSAPETVIKEELQRLQDNETYMSTILKKRTSLMDLLEMYPSHPVSFATFLAMLPPMRVRQYSISSSPLWNPSVATITFDVLDAPAFSGRGRKLGVASNHLANCEQGDQLACVVKQSSAAFHLPADPTTPVIMAATGSGIAPMRGFCQERAAQVACGRAIGKTILYYGCRDEEEYVHRDELEKWAKLGAVDLRVVFSRAPNPGMSAGVKYIQDRAWAEREELAELFCKNNARVYVCGSVERLGKSVRELLVKMYCEKKGCDAPAAETWLEEITGTRFAMDVFG